MRCLTLAGELRKRGAETVFVSREATEATAPALTRSGIPVLGMRGADEASALAALQIHWPQGCDLLVVDSYGIDASAECGFRAAARHIAVIDDLANRAHDCDLLLDQTFGRSHEDYAALVPRHCQVFTGSQYALLRPEFAAARTASLIRRSATGPVRRIMISLGLADPGGIAEQVTRAVLDATQGLAVDVVLGTRGPSFAPLKTLASAYPELTVHIDPQDLCGLMVQADIAVGAAGSTMWERCCLGLPAIALILADNQRHAAQSLEAAGCCIALDARSGLPRSALRGALIELTRGPALRKSLSARSSSVTDGQGALRIAAAVEMLLRPGSQLTGQPASR